jgi:hypothetical protein
MDTYIAVKGDILESMLFKAFFSTADLLASIFGSWRCFTTLEATIRKVNDIQQQAAKAKLEVSKSFEIRQRMSTAFGAYCERWMLFNSFLNWRCFANGCFRKRVGIPTGVDLACKGTRFRRKVLVLWAGLASEMITQRMQVERCLALRTVHVLHTAWLVWNELLRKNCIIKHLATGRNFSPCQNQV